VPTEIVLGDHDEAITRAHTQHMAAAIPGAKLVILKDASHFAMLQDPKGYTKAVRAFIGDPSSASADGDAILMDVLTQTN
jgi:pimeloyl-ACP methyl ester carboxylesterase